MAEYIDRGVLLLRIDCNGTNKFGMLDEDIRAFVKEQPAVDVAPVVHGHWVKHKKMHGFVYCSACKDVYLDEEWLRDGKWGYCPNCGARMDGADG